MQLQRLAEPRKAVGGRLGQKREGGVDGHGHGRIVGAYALKPNARPFRALGEQIKPEQRPVETGRRGPVPIPVGHRRDQGAGAGAALAAIQ